MDRDPAPGSAKVRPGAVRTHLEIDLGIARVDNRERDSVPASKLDKVFDGRDGDAEHLWVTREE